MKPLSHRGVSVAQIFFAIISVCVMIGELFAYSRNWHHDLTLRFAVLAMWVISIPVLVYVIVMAERDGNDILSYVSRPLSRLIAKIFLAVQAIYFLLVFAALVQCVLDGDHIHVRDVKTIPAERIRELGTVGITPTNYGAGSEDSSQFLEFGIDFRDRCGKPPAEKIRVRILTIPVDAADLSIRWCAPTDRNTIETFAGNQEYNFEINQIKHRTSVTFELLVVRTNSAELPNGENLKCLIIE